ncbi:hypothetical protein BU16DRAFT_50064 [Lophium mytilinum]|uniref:F-box domain-containing protein n=1 Tax=Lophium mytilinum TaxID=390894 RepID=A0A6A6QT09_9PEZI|nr:hypothetical protein BU16DRAFT_50064 [Lophium mytilinum]
MDTNPRRELASRHNATRSHILQLPVEALCMIGGHLSPVSALAVVQTCRKLRRDFPLAFFPLNEFDPEISRLERKLLPSTPESRISLASHRIWCSACGNRHSAKVFSPQQRASVPLERRCLGMEKKFRLCEHQSFTLAELNAAVTKYDFISCHHEDHPDSSCPENEQCFLWGDPLGDRKDYCHRQSFLLMYDSLDPVIPGFISRLIAALRWLDVPLCSHARTRTSDVAVLQDLQALLERDRTRYDRPWSSSWDTWNTAHARGTERWYPTEGHNPFHCPGHMRSQQNFQTGVFVSCVASECDCAFIINRTYYPNIKHETVFLEVGQFFTASAPTDEEWLEVVCTEAEWPGTAFARGSWRHVRSTNRKISLILFQSIH